MANPQTDTHAREQTKRDEQARKNGDAARTGVERLADFRQRATDDAWKSMESSVEAASQGGQNASESVRTHAGLLRGGRRTARPAVRAEHGSDHEVRDGADPSLSGHVAGVVWLGS